MQFFLLSFNYTDTFGERRPMNARFLEGRASKRRQRDGGDGSDRPFKQGRVSKFAKVKEKARLMKKMKQNGTFEEIRAQKRERKEERRANRPRPEGDSSGGGDPGFKRGDGGNRFAGNGNRDYQSKTFNSNKGSRPGRKKVVARKGRPSFRPGNA